MTIGGKWHVALVGGGRGRCVCLQLWHPPARAVERVPLSPGLPLHLVPFAFCTAKNSVSKYLQYRRRREFHCVKQKQKQHEEREGKLVPSSGLEVSRSRLQIISEISQKSISVGSSLLETSAAQGSLHGVRQALIRSRLLRLYASVYGAKAKAGNSIGRRFDFILIQDIHSSLKKPVAFTLSTTKAIPLGRR